MVPTLQHCSLGRKAWKSRYSAFSRRLRVDYLGFTTISERLSSKTRWPGDATARDGRCDKWQLASAKTRIAKQILSVLATGYILMFYSELVFWAHVRPDDSFSNWLLTWRAYSFLAFVFLTLVARFRIHTIWALFLAGAVFGLLAEGVLVQTTYESLPLSISFTALAWHALISVWVGWVAVNQVLSLGLRQTALLSAVIGLFFGFWPSPGGSSRRQKG